jgi:hypothetical protein
MTEHVRGEKSDYAYVVDHVRGVKSDYAYMTEQVRVVKSEQRRQSMTCILPCSTPCFAKQYIYICKYISI